MTITGLGVGDSVISVWRTADGLREPVRGARRAALVDSTYLLDYDAPLGRPITYEVEVISGPSGGARVTSKAVTVNSDAAWIMDPLVPQSAVSISRRLSRNGGAVFMVTAMRDFEYQANVSMIDVMGSDRPMALIGRRSAAKGVDISLLSDMAEQNSKIRALFAQAGQVLVRVPPSLSDTLPGACFLAVATVGETSRKPHTGSEVTTWTIKGDTVAAPVVKVLTATFTWGDVAILFSTYQQKQDAATGTYLDDLKHPLG
ncbi:hypothetical protein [Arthrobacter sp. ok362]|uniref:hypothetical protein n=1 Tax=Arthrobacter sp. ok362 TaxID=1761745 RepID=UPI0011135FCA|nr:hypothetical protein [Arthrobacter sp. ok362]